jgi:diguanylate cyclase (GGDEF)-like protein
MENESFNLLLIQPPGPGRDHFLKIAHPLAGFGAEIITADDFTSGRETLYKKPVDVIVMDLHLQDGGGLQGINALAISAPQVPLLALDTQDMAQMAEDVIAYGAQDWLQLSTLNQEILTRAIRYAFERHHLRQALQTMSLLDPTGLYNKTGFDLLAQQQLAWAQRQKRPFLIFYADVTNLEEIRQKLSEHEKENALLHFSRQWGANFRRSDIVAKYDDSTFVAFALDAAGSHEDLIRDRLLKKITVTRKSEKWPFKLEITLGCAHGGVLTTENFSLEELIRKAKTLSNPQGAL